MFWQADSILDGQGLDVDYGGRCVDILINGFVFVAL